MCAGSFSANTDEDIAIISQQKELRKFNKTAGFKSLPGFLLLL